MAQVFQPDPVPGGQGSLQTGVDGHGQEEGPKPPPLLLGHLGYLRGFPEEKGPYPGQEARQDEHAGIGQKGKGEGGEDRSQAEGHVHPV